MKLHTSLVLLCIATTLCEDVIHLSVETLECGSGSAVLPCMASGVRSIVFQVQEFYDTAFSILDPARIDIHPEYNEIEVNGVYKLQVVRVDNHNGSMYRCSGFFNDETVFSNTIVLLQTPCIESISTSTRTTEASPSTVSDVTQDMSSTAMPSPSAKPGTTELVIPLSVGLLVITVIIAVIIALVMVYLVKHCRVRELLCQARPQSTSEDGNVDSQNEVNAPLRTELSEEMNMPQSRTKTANPVSTNPSVQVLPERPTHLPDETLAPHETISALDLADIVPMIPNPAHECIDRFALDLADVSMTRNPAYVPVQPHHRGYMTFPQDCLTEPSPASNSRPLPCPPEIEMKRKQKQMQYKILPPPLPLPVPSIVPDSDDALGVDEAVPVPLTSDTFGYPEKKVELCPDLPQPLQHIRKLAYETYQRLSFTEDPMKVQHTKVAVLKSTPKASKKGNPDQSIFLKRFRDCGRRLSEGATEEVTVNDFLRAGSQQNQILYGQPGTGKTTFLKHLCQKVANDEPSDFSLVLYFPLRDKAVSQALMKDKSEDGLDQLLQYYIPGKKCSASADALLESKGENVLIIFDGADEMRGLMASPNGCLQAALLQGHLLPQAHFIVSTRPGACPLLQEHCSFFYEILGFDDKAVKLYVKDFFKSEPDKGEAMLGDLMARPDLMGGAYIPMNLLIFCSIYERGVAGRSVFPATMTECYKSSIARIVTQEKQKMERRDYQISQSLADLPPDVKHLLSSLGLLAFKGLSQEPPDYIFQEADVRPLFSIPPHQPLDEFSFSGLLHFHASQDPGYSTFSTLNFSHTTKQEFFAAYLLSLLPKAEQAAFWRENRHNPKFAVVLRYFAGLTQFKSAEVSKSILATVGHMPSSCDRSDPYLLYVFHTLFESQNESLTQSIVATQLSSCLTFDLYLTPFDIMVFRYCLTKCKHLTELHLTNISPISHASFHHVCSVVQCNPHLQSLTVKVYKFSTEDAHALCQAAGSLKRLKLGVLQSTFEALAEVFNHKSLEELDLAVWSDSEGDSAMLEDMVARCCLRKLYLLGSSMALFPVLSGLRSNCSITDLVLDDSSSSLATSTAVATCVQTVPQLKVLQINGISPLPVLQSLSHRDSPLVTFTVMMPQLEELSEVQLEEAASCAQVVNVTIDVMGSSGASRALAVGFSRNPLLTKVELRMVPKELVESIRGTLCTNTALTVKIL